jgi:hypothetical protein
MIIFNEIIKKYFEKVEKKNQKYLYLDHDPSFFLLDIFFDIFIEKKKYSVKEKYKFLENTLINIFLSLDCKKEFLNTFSQIQKHYFALLRFKFLLFFKKSKIVVENDLSLNPISEKDKFVLVIFQKNKKYLFHTRDLLHLINSAIGHSDFFFSAPISVKNPYNNSILSKSILYNIYFFMKFNTSYFSELFHHFFICNFDLSEFYCKNTTLLRKYAIQDYLKNTTDVNLLVDINEMLDDFNYENKLYKIIIDPDFPNKKLLEVMKPYVNLFIISKYSFVICEKMNAQTLLKKKLREFYTFNPIFGRKIIKINNSFNNKSKCIYENEIKFTDDYLSFHKNNKKSNDFLLSHSYFKSD